VCTDCTAISHCPSANLRCTTGSNQTCNDCDDGYRINGQSCTQCAANQYGDGQTCTQCTAMPGCVSANLRCDSPTGNNGTCTTCSAGYKKLNGVCVACQPGEFGDGNTCTACDAVPNCASGHVTCTSAADETCNQCDVGFKVQGGACVACASNEYGNGTTCTACSPISGCTGLTCPTGAANSTCSACQAPLILDGNQCVACVADGDCTATPAATCNLNVRTSYINDCTALLVCDYPSSQTTCDNGCSAGTCNVAAFAFSVGDATAVGAASSPVSLVKITGNDPSTGLGPTGEGVIVSRKVTPHNSVKVIELVYSINDPDFVSPTTITMTFDSASGADDIFKATIPPQTVGKTVRFYVKVTDWTNGLHFDPGASFNYSYVTQ
jgi:FlaG/FlaF family flagellin (archaellin)